MHKVLFNLHDVMLIMTSGLSFFLAVAILMSKRRSRADTYLAAFVLTQGIAALYYLFLYAAPLRPVTMAVLLPFQSIPLIALYLSQGLTLYWYSREMSGLPVIFSRKEKIMAVLMFALPITLIITVWFMGLWDHRDDSVGLALPPLIASLIYGVRAVRTVRTHDTQIRQRFSNIDEISLIWLSYAALGFVGVWCIRLVGYLTGFAGLHYWTDFFGSGSNLPAMMLITAMVILGLRQGQSKSDSDGKSQNRSANDEFKRPSLELVEKLDDLMQRVKLYQDPQLDLEGLADSLGISARSLSTLINGHYDKNFYDFVNHHRVLEVTHRLADPDSYDITIQRIFEDAGFNSKSTFNTFFKKVTGKTPTEFRSSCRKGIPQVNLDNIADSAG